MKLSHYKIVVLSSLGAGLEFFDFTIYALFAHYISQNFFPQQASSAALINTFVILAVGYLARPLGGIILGHIGDKYGRKFGFTYAMLAMAGATLLIGCLPNYQTIGILAPILLIILRLLQGLSMGGEVSGAITFTLEHYANHRPGLMQSYIICSMCLFSSFASVLGYILNHQLNAEQMLSWGWRIPFLLGFVVGIVGYILRSSCAETPEFLVALDEERVHKFPFKILMHRYSKQVVTGFCLTVFSGCFSALLLFTPTFLTMQASNFPPAWGFALSTVGFLCLGIASNISGFFTDYINYRVMLILGCLLSIIAGYLVFNSLIQIHDFTQIHLLKLILLMMVLGVSASLINSVYVLAIATQFPTLVRYSGIGLCQNLGIALAGGTAPLIFVTLIQHTQSMMMPYYYLFLCTLITLMAGLTYKSYTVTKDKHG